jgi:hypothetical protein
MQTPLKLPSSIRLILTSVAAAFVARQAMTPVTTYLYEHEDSKTRSREDQARQESDSPHEIAGHKLNHWAGGRLPPEWETKLGSTSLTLVGISSVLLYAYLRNRFPVLKKTMGVPFGLASFALIDEGFNSLAKLTPPPNRFPIQTHLRGLAGYTVYGIATEAALAASDRIQSRLLAGRSDIDLDARIELNQAS